MSCIDHPLRTCFKGNLACYHWSNCYCGIFLWIPVAKTTSSLQVFFMVSIKRKLGLLKQGEMELESFNRLQRPRGGPAAGQWFLVVGSHSHHCTLVLPPVRSPVSNQCKPIQYHLGSILLEMFIQNLIMFPGLVFIDRKYRWYQKKKSNHEKTDKSKCVCYQKQLVCLLQHETKRDFGCFHQT